LGKLKLVGVSVNNGEVLWFVLWSDWHEFGSGLGKFELVGVSLNNSEVLWLVLWSNWHEFGIRFGSDKVNLIKSNWDINETEVGGSLSVSVKN
jgi:hypothetical protein